MLSVLAGSMLFGNTVSVFAADVPDIVGEWKTDSNYGWIAGGYSENEMVSDKTITVTAGTAIASNADEIDGGYSINGAVKNNTAIVSGGAHNIISGGTSEQSDASGNSAVFSGESTTAREVFGADSASGNVSNNSVELTGGHVTNAVVGGRTTEGSTNDNRVIVSDYNGANYGSITSVSDYEQHSIENGTYAYVGGYVEKKGDATSNRIEFSNSEFAVRWASDPSNDEYDRNNTLYKMEVIGGYSENGNVKDNIVMLYDTKTNANLAGGGAHEGNVIGNEVMMTGENTLYSNNGISIVGGVIDGASGVVDSNEVTVNGKLTFHEFGGNGVDEIYGGMVDVTSVDYPGSSSVNVTNNKVTINAEIVSVGGGKLNVYGGYADAGKAIGNIVDIQRDITADVFGGYSNSGEVSGNIVNINAKVIGNVYGGVSETGVVKDNTITLLKDADVSEANLYGAEVIPVNARMMNIKAASTPNGIGKLVINGWGGEVNSLNNFSEIQFNNVTLPENGSVVTIKDAVGSDLSDTTINASKMTIAGGTDLSAGSTLNLMTAENTNDSLNIEEENVKLPDVVSVGVAQEADGKFVMEDGKLVYKVEEVRQSSQTKLIAENRAVAAAFVNQGTDLITDSLSVLEKDTNLGVKTFAAVHGNRSKYDVNSDLKINGWSSLIGVGNGSKLDGGDLNWGVFFENGSGNYRTYNSFNNEFFRGDGSLVYNGGGAMIRYNNNGFYTEASLRAGTLKSEIDGAVKDSAGNSYGYKSDTTYYGAHIGFGKVLELSDSTELDVYGKFFHTYNDSDSFEIAGDKFEFDSVTSDRLRVGARLNTNKAKLFNAYYGLAWEYEFNGDADMKTQNTVAPTQSLGGSSFMGEIGVNYKPGQKSPWSFDLSLRGYAGEREGVSSNLQANYSF